MAYARTEIDPTTPVRRQVSFTFNVKGEGKRTRTLSSGIVIEDDVTNKALAYLYALGLRKVYNREETPHAIRLDITRTGITP